tara:strand:+ start:390 stop:509 length:120 start_codon:yes stop_codon:yes gene_type:complete
MKGMFDSAESFNQPLNNWENFFFQFFFQGKVKKFFIHYK